MQVRMHPSFAGIVNAIGIAAVLLAACTAVFLTRGLSLPGALFIAFPATCALGICLLRMTRGSRARARERRASTQRRSEIRRALSLTTPPALLRHAVHAFICEYSITDVFFEKNLVFFRHGNVPMAAAAMPRHPSALPDATALLAHHEAAAKAGAKRLVIVSNEDAGTLASLIDALGLPAVYWMPPDALCDLPGHWPSLPPPARGARLIAGIMHPKRAAALWRYGVLMTLLFVPFRQIMFLLFGSVCVALALASRMGLGEKNHASAQPFG